jgi:hypothetical protein
MKAKDAWMTILVGDKEYAFMLAATSLPTALGIIRLHDGPQTRSLRRHGALSIEMGTREEPVRQITGRHGLYKVEMLLRLDDRSSIRGLFRLLEMDRS